MRFRRNPMRAIIAGAVVIMAPTAAAQSSEAAPPVYIFPADGQDADQQREDRMQCHAWAVDQSGYDPSFAALSVHLNSAAKTSQATTTSDDGKSVARSAVGGAAVGAIVGAISGDVEVGEGAAYGAGAGAVGGGLRSRRQRKEDEKAATAQAESLAEQTRLSLSNYGRAYKTCLEGRGYTIS